VVIDSKSEMFKFSADSPESHKEISSETPFKGMSCLE
jgi:hypothetical protein